MATNPAQESSSSVEVESADNANLDPRLRDIIGKDQAATGLHLLKYGTFSDLIITCQGTTFKVHRLYLLAKGGNFFQAAICGGFAESHTHTIDLPEDEPEMVARVLLHIYTGQYESGCAEEPDSQLPHLDNIASATVQSSQSDRHNHERNDNSQGDDGDEKDEVKPPKLNSGNVMIHVKMFAVAVKYGIPGLRDQARKAFAGTFSCWSDVWCLDKLPKVEEIITAVYRTTPSQERELRDLCVVQALVEMIKCKSCKGTGSRSLLKSLEDVPEFGADLACYRLGDPNRKGDLAYQCSECYAEVAWIIGPCACRKWGGNICMEVACVNARRAATVCYECGAKGTLLHKVAHRTR
ncbi:uncharacterized protein AB675_7475 [Cyphellophora attinorum]|uniref:BTB domain-containing protein n=1 Tax=Cyphellophora attinorum TaxID=1664694 RepID=A0A0N1H4K5_9EURO|nr:uncharacterized protein AB675_7475 [Phialophora attinorum]KPI40226.1 hypothetical protein AB675_7475 [Phialophora attinorum]